MKLIIDIPKDTYQYYVKLANKGEQLNNLESIILDGTPLPKGHGRLIDADALIDSLGISDRDIYCKAVIEEDAPTIIETDV